MCSSVCPSIWICQNQNFYVYAQISKLFFTAVFLNSLLNNKTIDWSKLKAFADYKINVTEKLKFVLGNLVNIVVKRENAGYPHFLLLLVCFQKASYTGSLKVVIVWLKVKE